MLLPGFFRVIMLISVYRSVVIKAKSTGKQGTPGHKSNGEIMHYSIMALLPGNLRFKILYVTTYKIHSQ